MEIKIDIPQFLDKALSPVAKECGERLADLISLVFTPVIKARAVRDKHLEKFLNELNNEVKKIPEEDIQSPPIHIVGPALEDCLKFYCDNDVIRKLFVKFISSSMNKQCNVHPSFNTIIKELSIYDLSLLKLFCFPFGSDNESVYIATPFTFFYAYDSDWFQSSYFMCTYPDKWVVIQDRRFLLSLFNLQRLSLILITDNKGVQDEIEIHVDGFEVERADGAQEKYTSFTAGGTRYLENFMNVCYSKELDQFVNIDMIFH